VAATNHSLSRHKIAFVLGAPGTGKSTLCTNLATDFGFTHISVGELFRREINKDGRHKAVCQHAINKSTLVPKEITMNLLQSAIKKVAAGTQLIIDGFPSSVDAITCFEKEFGPCDFVIHLTCSNDVLQKRLKQRGRDDDAPAISENRFKTFETMILPAVEHYRQQDKVHEINTDDSIDNVYKAVITILKKRQWLHPPEEEQQLREELATAYRIAAMLDWESIIHTHITVRVPGAAEHFLINPFGLLFEEITASSLIKVDVNGAIVDQGSTELGINPAGFKIHSFIHASERGKKGDCMCVWHTHYNNSVAVSTMECGLLPISTYANDMGGISYHDYSHAAASDEVCKKMVADLGPINRVLLLRNHGDITVGRTIGEAFYYMYSLHRACDIQVTAMGSGQKLVTPSPEALAENRKVVLNNYTGLPFGELEWQAMKRRLDNGASNKH